RARDARALDGCLPSEAESRFAGGTEGIGRRTMVRDPGSVTRRISRRALLALLGGVAGAGAALVACGGPPRPTTPAPAQVAPSETPGGRAVATAAAGDRVTLNYWGNWAADDPELTTKLLPGFESANPGIKVAYTNVPTVATTQASDKLVAAIKGG